MKTLLKTLPSDTKILQQIIKNQQIIITSLEAQLAALKRSRFGRSSEKLDREIEQLELMLEELAHDGVDIDPDPDPDPEPESDAPAIEIKTKPSRKKLPDHLPREEITHAPAESCPECGEQSYSKIGEDVTEILEYVPAHFKVISHIRPKHSCRACETIRSAELPSMPITKGKAGAGLLAHIIVSKYCDHLPLYRQSEIYAREGLELSRSTMSGWMKQIDNLIKPLGEALRKDVMSSDKLHGDDTTVPVLAPSMRKTKTGRIWVYVRDDRPFGGTSPPAAQYFYSPDRRGIHPQDHLRNYTGTLQADGYAGYNDLYKANKLTGEINIIEAACWAHVRRKFYEDFENTKSEYSNQILKKIGSLYDVEREIKGVAPDKRQKIRQEKSLLILDELKKYLEQTQSKISGKSALARAIRYALKRWKALNTYIDDGKVEIDNNAAERAMRPIALGRKNYLFAGSDRGGETAATFYSLIETAKMNKINPNEYLTDMLSRIADHPIKKIDELLPQNWTKR